MLFAPVCLGMRLPVGFQCQMWQVNWAADNELLQCGGVEVVCHEITEHIELSCTNLRDGYVRCGAEAVPARPVSHPPEEVAAEVVVVEETVPVGAHDPFGANPFR